MPCVIGATGIDSDPHLPERARLCKAGDRLGRQTEVLQEHLVPVRADTRYLTLHGGVCA